LGIRTDHILRDRITLPLPIKEVFAFFADAGNLERITPPELNFHIITLLPIEIQQGTLIDYRLRLFGIPFKWQTKITSWEPPYQFVDEQLHGPYRQWIHCHSFSESNGLTTVEDEVNYRLPFWPLGELALPVIHTQLQRIFSYRQKAIRSILVDQQ